MVSQIVNHLQHYTSPVFQVSYCFVAGMDRSTEIILLSGWMAFVIVIVHS